MQGPRIREVERRRKARFPICRDLRYKLIEHDVIVAEGEGETVNIGSGGVSFIAGQPLQTGTFAELSISWPAMLDENTRMRLVVYGRLLRSNNRSAVCTVDKYEFRTQARTANAELQIRRDGMFQRWVDDFRKDMMKMRGALA
jgi:hypothetical protein